MKTQETNTIDLIKFQYPGKLTVACPIRGDKGVDPRTFCPICPCFRGLNWNEVRCDSKGRQLVVIPPLPKGA